MFEPMPPESTTRSAQNHLQEQYVNKKDQYLELCWQYNLPPRDMSLLLMGRKEIAPADRIHLIRLIIQLVDLEKMLGPGLVKDFLFAADESQYFNSAVFASNLH